MNKVISFELKKIVSRPAIYVLAFCLAVLLTLSAICYKPIEKSKVYNKLDGNTVSVINNDFNTNYKPSYDSKLSNLLNMASEISENTSTSVKASIDNLYSQFNTLTTNYIDNFANNATVSISTKQEKVNEIFASVNSLRDLTLNTLGDEDNSYYKALITKKDYIKLIASFDHLEIEINNVLEKTNATNTDYQNLARKFSSDLVEDVKSALSNIAYPDYSNVIKKYLIDGNYYNVSIERLDIVVRKINKILDKVAENSKYDESKKLVSQYNDLFNEYRLIIEMYETALNAELNISCLNSVVDTKRDDLKYLKSKSIYKETESFTRVKYYIEHDKNEYDFASSLSFDYASNNKANGYDYTYFALSIFSILIIAFAIMMASHTIAGENKEGTLRFTAIRPVGRTSLYFGKFFAIAIMTLILLIFSAIACIVVGGFSFGLSSTNLLTIINATNIVVMHPSLAIIIYVASIYLQILVYISIAMLISLIFKSDLFAVISTMLIYTINL